MLRDITLSLDSDKWVWDHARESTFSMASSYIDQRVSLLITLVPTLIECLILSLIWISWAPSKILVFSWQLLQDRLLTRQNMSKIWVIFDNSLILCPFFEFLVESISRHFVIYELALSVWYGTFKWLGWQIVTPNGPKILFEIFLSLWGRSKFVEGYLFIFHLVVWSIWKSCNDIIFIGVIYLAKDVEKTTIFFFVPGNGFLIDKG